MKRRDFIFQGSAGIFSTVATRSFTHSFSGPPEWEKEGLGALRKIAILTPAFDPVPESEIRAMAPSGISIHSSRAKYIRNNPSSFVENVGKSTALLHGANAT